MTGRTRSLRPAPHATLRDESGNAMSWLASDFTPETIKDEWDYLFAEGGGRGQGLAEAWYKPRWTTKKELADEDLLYDLFGDWEDYGIDTSVVYDKVSSARTGEPGVHRYWEIDFRRPA